MRSATNVTLLAIVLIASAHSQVATRNRSVALSPSLMRIKALQSEVEKQQIEIDALRFRLGRLQYEIQKLADIIENQNSDSEDEQDWSDDSGVNVSRVRHKGYRIRKNMYVSSKIK